MHEFPPLGAPDFKVLTRHVPFETWQAIYTEAEKPSQLENLAIGAMAYLALQEVSEPATMLQLGRARTMGDFREFVIGSKPSDKLGTVALAQIRRIGRGAPELTLDYLIDDRLNALRGM